MDPEFQFNERGLYRAVDLLTQHSAGASGFAIPARLPEHGLGAESVLELLAPSVVGEAARLGSVTSLAHMDPPTPWITWATTLWNASLNQNLLHPATGPVARQLEEYVIDWLAPYFGMSGGHMTPGSTLANLTALWAARECAGIEEVMASESAHLSIGKAAHILGLKFRRLKVDASGALRSEEVNGDLSRTALVLTAGTTGTGAVDPLGLADRAAWTHVDAAWAGPLRLTKHACLLSGMEKADSVAVSAHKWLFQPKESALVFFRDNATASAAISFGSAYLAVPNVGILGSHGATAVPLLATLLAWGRHGLAARIENCMAIAAEFANFVRDDRRLLLHSEPQTGVVIWSPRNANSFDTIEKLLPAGTTSVTTIGGIRWFRNVAANPNADVRLLVESVQRAVGSN